MLEILILFLLGFGQNKIQTKNLKWEICETPHFTIYFTKGGEPLVDFAVPVLENTYTRLSNMLGIDVKTKVPVIIYNSPNDFRETNIILDLIEEGIGGFTEFYKTRVVVPFDGSYSSFEHVLMHELVHVFEFKLFYTGIYELAQEPFFSIPLYIMEGFPEYVSLGLDPETEGFVRDLILNDLFPSLKNLEYYGGYIVYKLGQVFFYFLYDTYGEEKIAEFLHALKFRKSVDKASLKVFGISQDALSERFSYYLKKKIYKEIEKYDYPEDIGKKITDHKKEGGFMNVGPAISYDGSYITFLSDRKDYSDIYLISIYAPEKVKKIVSGERVPSLENLHLLRPGICFSPDGKYLIFTSHGNGKEMINFYDLKTNKIIKSYSYKEFDGIYTPDFSPDGSKIVFVGIKDGKSDLYILNPSNGKILERITNDFFDERDPLFMEEEILFVSDRTQDGSYGSYAIFSYSLKDKSIRKITPYLGNISHPFKIEDSIYLFVYKEKDASNIFAYDKLNNKFYQITSFPTWIRETGYAKKSNDIVCSILWKNGYNIFYIKKEKIIEKNKWKEVELEEKPGKKRKGTENAEWKEYSNFFTIDWLGGTIGYAPQYGYYGNVGLQASDILGNLRIQFFTDMTGGDLTVSNWLFGIYYLPKKIDYLLEIYQFFPLYPYDSIYYSYERNLGFNFISLIPLNKFFRFEIGTGFTYIERIIDRDLYFPIDRMDYFINLPFYFGTVFDRSTDFYYLGVQDGERCYLGFEFGFIPENYLKFVFDSRKYWRITPRSNFAFRILFAGKQDGERILPFWLGGPNRLRGYDLFELVYPYIFLSSFELRVPFLDNLKLSFPLPLKIGNIRGIFFFDTGIGFKEIDMASFKKEIFHSDLGYGFRWNIGYFDLKFDFAYKIEKNKFFKKPLIWITFGRDF
ncbi:MAG: BamA/TamA family outer membrane protein [candidate division WOR-3 bacterium]